MDKIKPIICGIAGGTASGKSTLANLVKELATPEKAEIILLDSYYRAQDHRSPEERKKVNYDHPDAFEIEILIQNLKELKQGIAVETPKYNFALHNRERETRLVKPKPLLIVDGFLLFHFSELVRYLDLKVFVDASTEVRKNRRLARDVKERGRTPESVEWQWNTTVEPMHQKFCEPSKQRADVIFDGANANFQVFAKTILNKTILI